MKPIDEMNDQECIDYLAEQVPDIFLHAGEHPFCKYAAAFAARNHVVWNMGRAASFVHELANLCEDTELADPIHWLRAAAKVIQEKKP